MIFLRVFFWPFYLYLAVKAEERQKRWGRDREDDMLQRAKGWNRTRAAAIRTHMSYRGTPEPLELIELLHFNLRKVKSKHKF